MKASNDTKPSASSSSIDSSCYFQSFGHGKGGALCDICFSPEDNWDKKPTAAASSSKSSRAIFKRKPILKKESKQQQLTKQNSAQASFQNLSGPLIKCKKCQFLVHTECYEVDDDLETIAKNVGWFVCKDCNAPPVPSTLSSKEIKAKKDRKQQLPKYVNASGVGIGSSQGEMLGDSCGEWDAVSSSSSSSSEHFSSSSSSSESSKQATETPPLTILTESTIPSTSQTPLPEHAKRLHPGPSYIDFYDEENSTNTNGTGASGTLSQLKKIKKQKKINRGRSILFDEAPLSRSLVDYVIVVSAKPSSTAVNSDNTKKTSNLKSRSSTMNSSSRDLREDQTPKRTGKHDASFTFSDDDSWDGGDNANNDEERKGTMQGKNNASSSNTNQQTISDNTSSLPNQEVHSQQLPSFQPVITARYPLVDDEDNPLNPMVTHFCHPCGKVQTKNDDGNIHLPNQSGSANNNGNIDEIIQPSSEYIMPKIHHFVLTNDKGTKLYGTCLTIYEPSYSIDVPIPTSNDKNDIDNVENEHESNIDHQSKGSVTSHTKEKMKRVHSSNEVRTLQDGTEITVEATMSGSGSKDEDDSDGSYTIEVSMSNCSTRSMDSCHSTERHANMRGAHNEKREKITSLLNPTTTIKTIRKDYYLPRCVCLLSSWPYLPAFRTYITQIYRLYFSGKTTMVAPLERYIANICLEIPAPPPGVFELQIPIYNQVVQFWAPPYKQPIAWVSMPFTYLFSCLNIQNVIRVWHALTLERQVLLVSSQLSLLTIAAEILLSLLFPMTWSHLYIPVVPQFLTPMLDAPMPFLCGVEKECYNSAIHHISHDCIVVDLDTNTVGYGVTTLELPPIPLKRKMKLLKALEINAGHVFREARCLKVTDDLTDPMVRQRSKEAWQERLGNFDEAISLALTPDSAYSLQQADDTVGKSPTSPKQSRWDSVQEAFFRFYVALLTNYRTYLVFPKKGSKRKEGLRAKKFIAAQKTDYQPFLRELCYTQQFDSFITKRLYHNAGNKPDVQFFDESISAKLNRSKLKVHKLDTPLLQSAAAHKTLTTYIAPLPSSDNLPVDWRNSLRRSSSTHLSSNGSYPLWPETFDPTYFTAPRPLPSEIVSEFESQEQNLNYNGERRNGHDVHIDQVFGAQTNRSIEVGVSTVFFLTYASFVGEELVSFLLHEKKRQRRQIAATAFDANICMRNLADLAIDNRPRAKSDLPKSSAAMSSTDARRNKTFPDQTDSIDDNEKEMIQDAAKAQLDLAFHVLQMCRARKTKTDPVSYKYLIEACGRIGDTFRATQLMKIVHREGLVADSVLYSCLVNAFSSDDLQHPDESNYNADNTDGIEDMLPEWRNLEESAIDWKHFGTHKKPFKPSEGKKLSLDKPPKSMLRYLSGNAYFASNLDIDEETVAEGTIADDDAMNKQASLASLTSNMGGRLSSYFAQQEKSKSPKSFSSIFSHHTDTKDAKEAKPSKKAKRRLMVTEPVSKQILVGEAYLGFLYPALVIDTQQQICPECNVRVTQDMIIKGWKACIPDDYTTTCPHCKKSFIAEFSISTTKPDFVGSDGVATPLKCKYVSPWVLKKQLSSIIYRKRAGIRQLLQEEFRAKADLNAALWWNIVVSFMRHRLPISFLLQGSFEHRMITPTPDM